jgi:Rrf2 family transcriptional regulator, repressor of oqxAB
VSTGVLLGPKWFHIAVQALVVLAGSPEVECSSATIAQDLKAHAAFLRRVLAQLVRAQIVEAREGRDGGYRLARPPDRIVLVDVYQAVKLSAPPEDAVPSSGLNPDVAAALDEIGAEAEHRLLEVLSQYTIASVMERAANESPCS